MGECEPWMFELTLGAFFFFFFGARLIIDMVVNCAFIATICSYGKLLFTSSISINKREKYDGAWLKYANEPEIHIRTCNFLNKS